MGYERSRMIQIHGVTWGTGGYRGTRYKGIRGGKGDTGGYREIQGIYQRSFAISALLEKLL